MNNMSMISLCYAGNLDLLSPMDNAIKNLFHICEKYAGRYRLIYNWNKSEYLMFKTYCKVRNLTVLTFPLPYLTSKRTVNFNGAVFNCLNKLNYLVYYLIDDFDDQVNIEWGHRAIAIRCNMLARRFAHCNEQVTL